MKETIEKIRIVRFSKGYSQSYMAEQLDIIQRAYSKIECGHTNLAVDRLKAIAKVLEVDIKELIE
ncbi:MAG: helix-turn-helix domain-containing protein [Flavobacteriaceae bacterium]|nr:helix-turn-helix domain-containing protein [Flavobacteriaceae bacterium]